jgi:hydrogenase maturation protein HypF
VALAGGCLHNRILHHGLSAALQQAGLRVLHATALPPNDGALSLGQAHAAALQLLECAAVS